jgi:hypothetical protein
MNKVINNILFALFAAMLCAPVAYQLYANDSDIIPLNGAYEKTDTIPLTWSAWNDGTFQQNAEEIARTNLRIRPDLVRLRNELDFRLFNAVHAADIIAGSEDHLFSLEWSQSRAGIRAFTDEQVDHFCRNLKLLEQAFAADGKYVEFILVPSKEEVFSEFLPKAYREAATNTDFAALVRALETHKVNTVNMVPFYLNARDTSRYPLYSKTSVHWTTYGAHFAMEQIAARFKNWFKRPIYQPVVSHLETGPFRAPDGDQEALLNLGNRIDHGTFAYPVYHAPPADTLLWRPRVLMIADSYFWNIIGSWRLLTMFSPESKFLYYYNTVFPNNDGGSYPVSQLDMPEELRRADAVIILVSSCNMKDFPFRMQDDILRFFKEKHLTCPGD